MPDEEHGPGWERARDGTRFTRREFLAAGLGVLAGAAGGGAVSLARRDGPDPHGAEVDVGDAEELHARIDGAGSPVMTEDRLNLAIVTWDPDVPGARDLYGRHPSGSWHALLGEGRGLMALYRKDPHLGCRVRWCASSRWFENPCHGEKYNRWGEWMAGPAPRGLDRFASRVDDRGRMVVDLGSYLVGPGRDQRVLDQPPAGPHCVDT